MKIKKRVWKTGGSICTILPNFWTSVKNIKAGDFIYIDVDENNNLVISKPKRN